MDLVVEEWKGKEGVVYLQALNVASAAFASWQQSEPNPKWILAKNKAFR